jgi:4-hydroxy-3-methylbut-2-en-1-yl diphosphate reductase
MKIVKAEHLGMCFGVRDAITFAKQHAAEQPLTVLGELVHNEAVLSDLRSEGVQFTNELADINTAAVMITAHGASDKRLAEVRQRGHDVLESTCPLVHYAHRRLRELVEAGFHPVIIGRTGHVEVLGLTEDLVDFDIVLSNDDVSRLQERSRFGIVAQTTQPIDRVRSLVDSIKRRFPHAEVRLVDTVCQPTKQRQTAAIELAEQSDAVVVIGGAHSNNTKELVATCRGHCSRVFHVQTADDLCEEWFDNVQTLGLTAGTSTPDEIIFEIEERLKYFSAQPIERQANV